jgi:hypothetical protein
MVIRQGRREESVKVDVAERYVVEPREDEAGDHFQHPRNVCRLMNV